MATWLEPLNTLDDNELMRRLGAALQSDGILYLPDVSRSIEHRELAKCFGRLQPQYDGELLWDIKVDPAHQGHYHSLNNMPLTPHTEYYEMPGLPHRFQALWCVEPSVVGGETLLADGHAFLKTLDERTLRYLKNTKFRFESSAGIKASGLASSALHPIVEDAHCGPIVRFSVMCMDARGDPRVAEVQQQWVEHFDQTCMKVAYQKGSFLIWDNWRVLHSRTGFAGVDRHLRRAFINSQEGMLT